MYDTYEDAALAEITARQARAEIEDHGLAWADFVEEVGLKQTYTGREVLDWLGY